MDQIGRTTDSNNDGVQDLVPLFVWGNKDDGVIKNMTISGCDVVPTTYLKEGRDFYNNAVTYNPLTGMYEAQFRDDDGSIKQWKYKPYTYPHPLTLVPFGTNICGEGVISSSCWCEGMKSTGYCCHGYYQMQSCDSGSGCVLRGDLNCNGCMEDLELSAFIDRWKISNQDVTLKELIEAIGLWKKPCP
ncbi:MAG: hypothetical protein NTY20_04470 [Candidatus Aenigmarchaeota archaeon]|nr:hypothetical protein [Candidatus Aenigmarchaeota archaeon]